MQWRSAIPHSLGLALWAATTWAQPSGAGTATVIERAVLASSCSSTDVQTAVTAATAGDTVLIPAGSCTWSTSVALEKAIHVRGASAASTTIAVSTPDTGVLYIASSNVEISHLTLSGGARIQVNAGNDWRIHDMVFTSASTAFTALFVRGTTPTSMPRGLIDSSTFLNGRVLVHGYPGIGSGDLTGTTHWSSALGLGTNEAVYVEDNTFTFTEFYNVFDCEYSGRIVFRYNTVADSYLETHSVQGFSRACRKWEVYENTIAQSGESIFRPIFFRGGTGVIFNNTVTGTYGAATIHFDNVRTFTDAGGTVGLCDGDSIWDGNDDASGYPCRDQIGRGVDAFSWPASAPYPAQSLDPAYIWGNTLNGSALGVTVVNGSENDHILANRDYYVNVGAKPGYAAYTYPHPLRAQ